ncbi:unnamed protein product [Paramecium primaurelia]|uniref:Protein kinase domain-containing protein n=1 Tax=Paramecium primaurelia TaxID=5886 RepID=A0A8S1M819_PARPR|nr:unnamed protein product [Paramecium primaurelia]
MYECKGLFYWFQKEEAQNLLNINSKHQNELLAHQIFRIIEQIHIHEKQYQSSYFNQRCRWSCSNTGTLYWTHLFINNRAEYNKTILTRLFDRVQDRYYRIDLLLALGMQVINYLLIVEWNPRQSQRNSQVRIFMRFKSLFYILFKKLQFIKRKSSLIFQQIMNCKSKHFLFSTDYKLYLNPKYIVIGKVRMNFILKSEQNLKYKIPLNLSTIIKWIFNGDSTFNGFQFQWKNSWKTILLTHDQTLTLKDNLDGKVTYSNLAKMYNLIHCERSGYSSKVYLTYCCANQKKYYMQIFPISDLTNQEYIRLIQIINITHPNILKCEEYFVEEKNLYIVTNILNGRTLKERIGSQYRMEPQEIISIMKTLLKFINDMHKQGYVFREITSTNIFLQSDGEILLIDFELLVKIEEAFRTKAVSKEKDFMHEFKDSTKNTHEDWVEMERFCYEQHDVLILGYLLKEMLTSKVQQLHSQERARQLTINKTILIHKSPKYYLCQLLQRMLEPDPKGRITIQNAMYFLEDIDFDDNSYEDFPDTSEEQQFQPVKSISIKTFLV